VHEGNSHRMQIPRSAFKVPRLVHEVVAAIDLLPVLALVSEDRLCDHVFASVEVDIVLVIDYLKEWHCFSLESEDFSVSVSCQIKPTKVAAEFRGTYSNSSRSKRNRT
jgi:hypothetical protein